VRAIGLKAGSAECCRLSASLMAFGCGSALGFRPGYPSSARLSVGEQPSRSGEPKARPIADSKGREEGREEKREERREEKREEGREEKREEGREEKREEGREERREEGREERREEGVAGDAVEGFDRRFSGDGRWPRTASIGACHPFAFSKPLAQSLMR
jgi:hypothetical protein